MDGRDEQGAGARQPWRSNETPPPTDPGPGSRQDRHVDDQSTIRPHAHGGPLPAAYLGAEGRVNDATCGPAGDESRVAAPNGPHGDLIGAACHPGEGVAGGLRVEHVIAHPGPQREADSWPSHDADVIARSLPPGEHPTILVIGPMADAVTDSLVALGALAEGVEEVEEVAHLVRAASAVVIDAGATLGRRWGHAMASARARGIAPPVVLVATLVDRSPVRRNEVRRFVAEARPAVIRGSPGELAALVGLDLGPGPHREGTTSITQLAALRTGAVAVSWTQGEARWATATVTGSARIPASASQARSAAHAVDAATTAFLACGADPLEAVRDAIAMIDRAMRVAAGRGAGPGSFEAALLDALEEGAGEAIDCLRTPGDARVSPSRPLPGASTDEPVVHSGQRATLPTNGVRPDQRQFAFGSNLDDVANRVEGGRVVPGAVPSHLLAAPSSPSSSADASEGNRWSRVLAIPLQGMGPDGSPVPSDASIEGAIQAAVEVGATAILLDAKGLGDAVALEAARRAVEAADPAGLAVAIRGRIDLAVATGAAAWIEPNEACMPVAVAAAVASGRTAVIASVATLDEARDAAANGATVLAIDCGSTLGTDAINVATGLPVARLLPAPSAP